MKLFLLIILSIQGAFAAKVTCSPSSCSPSCGSSCTYYTCTGTSQFTKDISSIPVVIQDESTNSCNFSEDSINTIPFTVSGQTYNQIPASVIKRYNVCQAQTNYGPACPVIP